MGEIVSYQLQGDIGVMTLNNPPVNALSQVLRQGMKDALELAQNDNSRAVIIICEGRTFIAGADLTEFGAGKSEPSLNAVFDLIENCKKPVIAAIHGSAFGGGLETALICDYRVALVSSKLGLPEVKLGLLPGAGGTQRVPRIAGVKAALDLMTIGAPITATMAKAMNIVDQVFEGDLSDRALTFARDLVARGAPLRRVRDIIIDRSEIEDGIFDRYRQNLARRAKGQLAPQNIIACIEAAVTLSFEEGIKLEKELFTECLQSDQSAAMRHIFFAEREAIKIRDIPRDIPLRNISSVAIIGAGTMGGGIAMTFANAGIPVTLLELNAEALERGINTIAKNYAISVKREKLTESEAKETQDLITGTTSYNDLAVVDLVIEAVFENLDVKKKVFAKLDEVCKPGAIMASNTSFLDIDAMAAETSRPQDVIGLHFFSPANIMKLLEVVRANKTADDVVVTAMKLAKTIGKNAVLARVCFGFIGNRMLQKYIREAQLCMISGATPKQIDDALENWGMAMGPIAMGDLTGLDVGFKSREGLSEKEKGDPASYAVGDRLVGIGRLGQKSGAGYYTSDAETRARKEDPAVLKIIEEQAARLGVRRREYSEEDIVERLILPLVNEGARILEEGIAQRPSDIDVTYIYGYSFPVFRGGPMYWADSLGLDKVYQRLCDYRDETGSDDWEPAPLLRKLAKEGGTFAGWSKER